MTPLQHSNFDLRIVKNQDFCVGAGWGCVMVPGRLVGNGTAACKRGPRQCSRPLAIDRGLAWEPFAPLLPMAGGNILTLPLEFEISHEWWFGVVREWTRSLLNFSWLNREALYANVWKRSPSHRDCIRCRVVFSFCVLVSTMNPRSIILQITQVNVYTLHQPNQQT